MRHDRTRLRGYGPSPSRAQRPTFSTLFTGFENPPTYSALGQSVSVQPPCTPAAYVTLRSCRAAGSGVAARASGFHRSITPSPLAWRPITTACSVRLSWSDVWDVSFRPSSPVPLARVEGVVETSAIATPAAMVQLRPSTPSPAITMSEQRADVGGAVRRVARSPPRQLPPRGHPGKLTRLCGGCRRCRTHTVCRARKDGRLAGGSPSPPPQRPRAA